MISNRTRVGLCAAAALLSARPVCSAADEPAALVVLTLQDQANEIWSGLPDNADDPRVTLVGGASRECSAEALRRAKSALAQAGEGRMALRSLSLALSVSHPVARDLGRGRPGELIAPYLNPGTRSDQVGQPLAAPGCEDGGAFYDLRATAEAPGRLSLHMLVEGGCGCTQGASGSGRLRFQIAGDADLEPGILERKNVLRLRAAAPRYFVLAKCGSCDEETAARRTNQPAKVDPCGPPCAPLANGFAAWQQEANQAATRVADLAGKATILELDIRTQKRELGAAQASARKPPSVLERISALQERIKAAQAELTRVTRASQEIQRYLDAARQASDRTRAADQRCQSQCRAQSERSPHQEASTGANSGGVGGVSTGVLIAGGAALAAGGVAVATLGKGDADAPANGPVSFAGSWVGTRTTTATVNQPGCTRVFDEMWVISQNGTVLRADITARAQGCGPQPACGACQIFSFPRFHNGSAEGTTARFFVFPELETPSCVLPLRLSGDTLNGSMPACDTGAPDTLSDVVTLRRSGP